ncbi:MAG TPA: LysE family translocator [Burkholderiaceae bacterium]
MPAVSVTALLAGLLPLAVYAFVSSITPGPNNMMLTASGMRFGFRRTIFHLLGVTLGSSLMVALFALGVGGMLMRLPGAQPLFKALACAYLLYMAWGMRKLAAPRAETADERPISFFAAVSFQFVNPKVWMMALTAASTLMPPGQPMWLAVLATSVVFSLVNLPCISVWAAGGAALGRHLERPGPRAAFAAVMIALTLGMALSLYW